MTTLEKSLGTVLVFQFLEQFHSFSWPGVPPFQVIVFCAETILQRARNKIVAVEKIVVLIIVVICGNGYSRIIGSAFPG